MKGLFVIAAAILLGDVVASQFETVFATGSVERLNSTCAELLTQQREARREIVAHGLVLRDELLRRADRLPAGVEATWLAEVFFNAYTFTANHTWEVFEPDCTTFVTTGDIPQMWLRDSSVQMSTYVWHAPLLPSLAAVLESIVLRQVRFFLGDPYGSAFFRTSGPGADVGPNKNECAPSAACARCNCSACAPACSLYTYQHDFELDSPLFVFLLQYKYWQAAPRRAGAFLRAHDEIPRAVRALVELLTTEQNHFRDSPYYYKPARLGTRLDVPSHRSSVARHDGTVARRETGRARAATMAGSVVFPTRARTLCDSAATFLSRRARLLAAPCPLPPPTRHSRGAAAARLTVGAAPAPVRRRHGDGLVVRAAERRPDGARVQRPAEPHGAERASQAVRDERSALARPRGRALRPFDGYF